MEIYELHSWDIFLQGFFLLACLVLGLYIIFKDSKSIVSFKNVKTLKKFSEDIFGLFNELLSLFGKSFVNIKELNFKYLGLVPIVIILSFIMGILGRGVADDWIDSNNKSHLYLKSTWSREFKEDEKVYEELLSDIDKVKYRDLARKVAFYTVFNIHPNDIDDHTLYHHIFYQSKHELLNQKENYVYLRKSQTMTEYSRVFSLGFIFLVVCGYVNFLIILFRVLINSKNFFPRVSTFFRLSKKESDDGTLKLHVNAKKIRVYFKIIFNESNSVIAIFLFISWLIIEYIINPYFDNYKWYEVRYLMIGSLVYIGILVFILLIRHKYLRCNRFVFLVYSILYLLSFSGYFVSSRAWLKSEIEVAKKVYGLYKTNHATKDLKELKFAEDELCLDVETKTKKKS